MSNFPALKFRLFKPNLLRSELMPNKFRHIGICIADAVVFVVVVLGPVVGRYAIETGNNWQYIFWAGFIGCFISLVFLVWLYHVSWTSPISRNRC